MYWMGRYLERVENTARLVAVYSELLLDLPAEAGLDWPVALQILGQQEAWKRAGDDEDALAFLLASENNPASLRAVLAQARENARTTRDVVPSEAWRAINELHLVAAARLPARNWRPGSRIPGDIVRRCHEITGILEGTMSHGPAYRFVCLGRALERADMTSRIIDVAAAVLMAGRPELDRHDNAIWQGVLRALSAYQMYRQYVRRRVEGLGLRLGPRAYGIERIDELLHAREPAVRILLKRLLDRLDQLQRDAIDAATVHRFVDDLQLELATLHDVIFETWLNPMRVT